MNTQASDSGSASEHPGFGRVRRAVICLYCLQQRQSVAARAQPASRVLEWARARDRHGALEHVTATVRSSA